MAQQQFIDINKNTKTITASPGWSLKQDDTIITKSGGTITGDLSVGNLTVNGMPVSNFEQAPEPDVHIPFTDSLQLRNGYGDDVYVGKIKVYTQATFSRASTATYIDKSGVLRVAGVNESRFEKEGLLIEGASTNTHIYSDYTHQNFSRTRCSTTTEGIDNGIQWYKQIASDDLSGCYVYLQGSYSQVFELGVTYTYSVFIKRGNTSTFRIVCHSDSFPANTNVIFNFDTEDFSSIGAGVISAKSIRLGSGIYRISVTATCDKDGGKRSHLLWQTGYSAGDYWFMANPQIEALPFATSYIPTSGAAATRAADVCSIPWANNGNAQEQTISAQWEASNRWEIGANARRHIISSTSGAPYCALYLYKNTDNTNTRLGSIYGTSGTDIFATLSTGDISSGTAFLRYDGVNATIGDSKTMTTVARTTTGLLPTCFIGCQNGNARWIWGHIRNLRIWHRALSDAQLRSLR